MKMQKPSSLQVHSLVWALPVVLVLAMLIGTVGCSAKSPEELVEERCVDCHALTVVTTSQKTRAEWEQTVNRMVEKGARLSEKQVEAVVDYLSETYGAGAQ
jgi:cytochrome c-type biogenesis protein CcmH/NrfF